MKDIKISEGDLMRLIKKINLIPKTVGQVIVSDLTNGKNSQKEERIFNLEVGVEILNEEEKFNFFKKVFNLSRSEALNSAYVLDNKRGAAKNQNEDDEENMIFDKDEIISMAEYADNAKDGLDN